MLYTIAVVEDDETAMERLVSLIGSHPLNAKHTFRIERYPNAYEFLEAFKCNFDLLFLDIQLGGISGMEAARRVREKDGQVLIVFVTSMGQYAVESYDVQACDFILKPVDTGSFSMKFDRVCRLLEHNANEECLTVSSRFGAKKMKIADISYVESSNHTIIYHLPDENFSTRDVMDRVEERLEKYHFVRCNSGYLVNLKYVEGYFGDYITVKGESLKISKARKQKFLSEFTRYVGGSV